MVHYCRTICTIILVVFFSEREKLDLAHGYIQSFDFLNREHHHYNIDFDGQLLAVAFLNGTENPTTLYLDYCGGGNGEFLVCLLHILSSTFNTVVLITLHLKQNNDV